MYFAYLYLRCTCMMARLDTFKQAWKNYLEQYRRAANTN